jgi:ribonuclease I
MELELSFKAKVVKMFDETNQKMHKMIVKSTCKSAIMHEVEISRKARLTQDVIE